MLAEIACRPSHDGRELKLLPGNVRVVLYVARRTTGVN